MPRLPLPDHLKALGITLVVYEHFPGVPQWLRDYIFSFHMPLFFLVSGALLKEESLRGPWPAWVKRCARQLLPSYAVFGVIGYLFWYFIASRYGTSGAEQTGPLAPAWAWVWGSAKDMFRQPLTPSPLWFLPCLFAAQALFHPLAKLRGPAHWAAVSLAGALGLTALQQPDFLPPYGLDSAFAALPFLALGRWWGRSSRPLPFHGPARLGAGAVLLTLGAALSAWQGHVDIRGGGIAKPAFFHLTAVLTVTGWACLLSAVPRFTLSERLSRESLVLFALHPMVYTLLTGVMVMGLRMPIAYREIPWISACFTLACLTVLLAAAPLIRRYTPFLPGSGS